MNTFFITDIHGQYDALLQCFERSGFNKDTDLLIFGGDVCDRGPKVKECIKELLSVKNLIPLRGNHDHWTLQYYTQRAMFFERDSWVAQGGKETIQSLGPYSNNKIKKFLKETKPYYIDEQNRIFVHGGFSLVHPIEEQTLYDLIWDRNLIETARHAHFMNIGHGHKDTLSNYKEIFIGHTPTLMYQSSTPINYLNLWACDTGACYGGKLTIINVDTKEYFQSDNITK